MRTDLLSKACARYTAPQEAKAQGIYPYYKPIDIMLEEPERIGHLWDVSNYAREQFRSRGFDTGRSETPIIPLFVRDSEKSFCLCNRLLEEGVFVTPVIAPAVPENDALIRFALMATHTYEQVDEAIDKITKAFRDLEIIR